jgi:MFS family permease
MWSTFTVCGLPLDAWQVQGPWQMCMPYACACRARASASGRRACLASRAARRRFGAPAFLGGILMLWGGVTLLFAFMRTAAQFYALRFLLGIAESGARPLRGASRLLARTAPPA